MAVQNCYSTGSDKLRPQYNLIYSIHPKTEDDPITLVEIHKMQLVMDISTSYTFLSIDIFKQ